MSAPTISILYEDQRGPMRGFAPHELVVQCVGDELGMPEWGAERRALSQRLKPIPKKGDSKLLTACREEVPLIGASGQPVVALFDDDRIRKLVGLPADTPKRDVATEILRQSAGASQLVVWMLVSNMETLVAAAAKVLGRAPPEKSPSERDRILQQAAQEKDKRSAVRASVPSFDCFVQVIARLVSGRAVP